MTDLVAVHRRNRSLLSRAGRLHDAIGLELVSFHQGLVRSSGVLDLLAQWRTEDGTPPCTDGRRMAVSDEAILTLFLLNVTEPQPMNMTNVRRIARRLNAEAAEALGLPGDRKSRSRAALYDQLWRSWTRITGVLDPYVGEPRQRILKTEYAAVESARDPVFVARRRARALHFANTLLAASLPDMNSPLMDGWEGDVVVDGTPVLMDRRGTRKKSATVSSNATAGWSVRDHSVSDGTEQDSEWAYELTLAAVGQRRPQSPHPKLILGLSMDRPGVNPSGNGRTAMEAAMRTTSRRGYLVGDMAYHPQMKPETWQIPMRRAGYELVGDIPGGQHGIQASHKGAELVDGQWYCPAMPRGLKEATTTFREKTRGLPDNDAAGLLAEKKLQDQIRLRANYLMRDKQAPDANGTRVLVCPAEGAGATCNCPFKDNPKAAKNKALHQIVTPPAHKPPVCRQSRISVPLNAGVKHAFGGPQYGTPAWHEAYNSGRQVIESKNNQIKSGITFAMDDVRTRLMRGFTNQLLIMTMVCMATNLMIVRDALDVEAGEETTRKPCQPSRRPSGRLRYRRSSPTKTRPAAGRPKEPNPLE